MIWIHQGQVVIPQRLRKQLGVQPQTKFVVFGEGDAIVLRRLRLPDIQQEWENVFRDLGATGRRLGPAEIHREIQARRRVNAGE